MVQRGIRVREVREIHWLAVESPKQLECVKCSPRALCVGEFIGRYDALCFLSSPNQPSYTGSTGYRQQYVW